MVEFAFSHPPQAMCISVAASRLRSLPVIIALLALPTTARAQRQATPGDPLASQDSVVILESVRVRTAPSPASLSIDEVPRGTALAIEAGSPVGGPWIAVRFDERTAFVPREYVSIRLAPRAPAPVAASTPSAPPAAAPQPTRVAVAVVDTARSAPAKETAPPMRETPAPTRETPAPVRQAGTPLRSEAPPVARETPAPRVSAAPAAPAPAPARETAPAEQRAPASAQAAPAQAAPAQAAPQNAAQDPTRMRRPALPGMVSVALLGSLTSYTVTATTTRVLHVSGHPLITLSAFGWGVYVAPEFGAGAGHRSTMIGGGLKRDILGAGPIHVSALAGVTTYAEEPDGYYAASFVSRSIRAASGGALVSLPFIGPSRLAYRGQYLRGLGDQSTFTQLRHAVGLQF